MLHLDIAVIVAAGKGRRLGLNMPKCLLQINDITFIEQQLKALQHISNIYIVVGFKQDTVIEHICNNKK